MTTDAGMTLMHTRMRRYSTVTLMLLGILIGALGLASSASASVPDGSSTAPSIWSDLADYPPGATVILRGTNWQPGESVHVVVDDDGVDERPWQHDATVTADAAGEVVEQFQLPDWFVADYTVTATGESSGTATTTFTDAISTTTLLSSNANPSVAGQPVTFTATVTCSQTCSFDAQHSVDFKDGANASNCNGGTTLGTVSGASFTGTGLSRQAKFTTPALSSGGHSVVACFSGGGQNPRAAASNSSPLSQVVNAGAPTKLFVRVQPAANANLVADAPIAPALQVEVQDKDGTIVPDSTASVTVALGNNPGGAGALSGTKTVGAVDGVATFSDLSINANATGYTLAVSSAGLTGATSNAFNIIKRSVSTSVSCSPSTTGVNQATTCTGTVTDTAAGDDSAPTGSVAWTRSGGGGGGAGSFSPTTCALVAGTSSAKCSVTYTPTSGTGSHTVTANYGGDAKHVTGSGNATLTVNNLAATTLTVSPASATVGGTVNLSATLKKASDGSAISGRTITFAVNGNSAGTAATNAAGVATLANAGLGGASVGSYPGGVVATYTGDTGSGALYNGSTGSGTLTVNPACTVPSVTANPAGKSITYGDNASFTAAANGNPAPTVAWQVSTDGGTSWNHVPGETGTTLSFTKPAVSQSGNRYRAVFTNDCGGTKTATSDPATLTIAKKAVTASFTAANKAYDGNRDATINGRELSGVLGSEQVSLSGGSALFEDKNVGAAKTVSGTGFALAGDDAGNYELAASTLVAKASITAKSLTGSFTAANKAYDGNRDATINGRELSGVLGSEQVSLSGGSALFEDKNVGAAKTVSGTGFALAGDDKANYELALGTLAAKADITAKTLTGAFTVANKVYDATRDAEVTGRSLSGTVDDDMVSLTGGSATFGTKDVGTDKTVTGTGFELAGDDAGNYDLTGVATAEADISAKTLTGSFTAADKVYDGTRDATITDRDLSGVLGTEQVTLSGGTALFDTKNVGNDKDVSGTGFALAGDDAGNYELASSTLAAKANISAKTLTGSFTAADKVYDGTRDATITKRELSGVLGSEDVALSGGSVLFDTKDVGSAKDVSGTGFALTGDDAGNYKLAASTLAAKANITAKTVSGSFTAANKVYDGTRDAEVTGRSLTGTVDDDKLSLSGGSALFEDKNAGTDKTVTGTGFALAGDDKANYELALGTLAAKADITAKTLTGAFTAASKVYDGTRDATITTRDLTGVLGSEQVTLDGGSALFEDKNVGTAKDVTGTGFTLAGEDKANYELASSTLAAKADISAKALTGSFTAANKVYDSTRDATVTGRDLSGVVGTETVTLVVNDSRFATKTVGTGKAVTGDLALLGADAGNYSVNASHTAKANITERDLTVAATGVNKVYDGGTDAPVTLTTDKVSGDAVAAAYDSAQFAGKNVGTSKPVTVTGIAISGDDASNYRLVNTMAGTTASITRKPLTGAFTANDKPYDGTRAATVKGRSLAGVVGAEDVTLAVSDPLFATASVGSNKDVIGALSLSGPDAGNYSVNGSHTTKAAITAWSADGHGFYQPVGIANSTFLPSGSTPQLPAPNATTVWNVAKGGSTIPLKFNVFAAAAEKTSTSDVSGFTAVKLSACATGSSEDPIEFLTSGSTTLRYDTTDRVFIQNWKTPSVSADSCYRATATFADGSTLSAFFKLRR